MHNYSLQPVRLKSNPNAAEKLYIEQFLEKLSGPSKDNTGIIYTVPQLQDKSDAVACSICGSSFTLFLRKQNCMNCGLIYCKPCSSAKCCIPKFGYKTPVNTCNYCSKNLSFSNLSREELMNTGIRDLTRYLKAYGLFSQSQHIEKKDLVETVFINRFVPNVNEMYYRSSGVPKPDFAQISTSNKESKKNPPYSHSNVSGNGKSKPNSIQTPRSGSSWLENGLSFLDEQIDGLFTGPGKRQDQQNNDQNQNQSEHYTPFKYKNSSKKNFSQNNWGYDTNNKYSSSTNSGYTPFKNTHTNTSQPKHKQANFSNFESTSSSSSNNPIFPHTPKGKNYNPYNIGEKSKMYNSSTSNHENSSTNENLKDIGNQRNKTYNNPPSDRGKHPSTFKSGEPSSLNSNSSNSSNAKSKPQEVRYHNATNNHKNLNKNPLNSDTLGDNLSSTYSSSRGAFTSNASPQSSYANRSKNDNIRNNSSLNAETSSVNVNDLRSPRAETSSASSNPSNISNSDNSINNKNKTHNNIYSNNYNNTSINNSNINTENSDRYNNNLPFDNKPRPSATADSNIDSTSSRRKQNEASNSNTSSRNLPTGPITLEYVVNNNYDVNALSIKELKKILQKSHVDYTNVLEKSELVSRVKILVENTKTEMSIRQTLFNLENDDYNQQGSSGNSLANSSSYVVDNPINTKVKNSTSAISVSSSSSSGIIIDNAESANISGLESAESSSVYTQNNQRKPLETNSSSINENIDSELCKLCFDNVINCVLVSCGHLCSCIDCAEILLASKNPECPYCRQRIEKIMHIFKV
ncbi:E3 ubiquitin-protein ligase RNF34 [Smittium culicis]|uniref:E3 ubiquitin-protein ligase RNF34 n=1 Tax=Smittium culicis TaxID=133412 RepID=A0A1R1XFY6_9FUNG|nr:E3 ubiquitin-protein ligase RNF34 [Smittium culicis]